MLFAVLAVLVALLVAAAVLVYVAYPYRGQRTPLHPAVGQTLQRGVQALPTMGASAAETTAERHEVYAGR